MLLLLLFCRSTLSGDPCDRPDLHSTYLKLSETVNATQPIQALELADSLEFQFRKEGLENCELLLWIRYERGEALELMGLSEEALTIYYELVSQAEKAKAWKLAAETYLSIARTHESIERPEDCRRNLQAALSIILREAYKDVFARYAIRNASFHRQFEDKDSALRYAALAVTYGKRFDVERSVLDGYLLLGLLTEDHEEALQYLQQAVDLCLLRQDYNGAAYQKLNRAKRQLALGRWQSALLETDTALNYAALNTERYYRDRMIFLVLYDFKRQLYEEQGKIDSAYHYLLESRAIERSINVEVSQEGISQKEILFNVQKEQEKLLYERRRSFNLRWGLVLLGLLLAVLVFLLLNNERRKRFIARQKDLISSKNEALNASLHRQSLLLSEIHHRVKNNLQLVMSLLDLQGRNGNDALQADQLRELSDKVYSIALIHEHLYRTGELEKIELKAYIEGIVAHLRARNSHENFSIDLDIMPLSLNLETALPLGVICTELIGTALKQEHPTTSTLQLSLVVHPHPAGFEFCFEHNQTEAPAPALDKDGELGALLIRSMVRQLQADRQPEGTATGRFVMTFREKVVARV